MHSRHATGQVLDALSARQDAGVAVLHWFSGTVNELQRAVDMGCWFSVGPSMLGSSKGRSLVSAMPYNRILTESDGPFAQLERRPVLPWDVVRAVDALSLLWNVPSDVAGNRLLSNLSQLVRQRPH